MDITLDTDWGAKGAQLTGAQVQAFIKQQLRALIAKDTTLQTDLSNIDKRLQVQESNIDAVTDGCMIAYHRKSDNWPCAVPYWEWPDIEASGEVADGVLVLVDGQTPILVAPTDRKLFWAKYEYDVDLQVGTNHELAYTDFTGQTRTAALIARSSELFGTAETIATEYAAAWCFNYDRSYKFQDELTDKVTTIGVQKNLWWLPSIAELVIIWKHKYAINQCLSVIKDSMPITDTWYWSSTEASSTTAWRLHMGTGTIQGSRNKIVFMHQTRAVTSFYAPSIFNGESDLENEEQIADNHFTRIGNCAVYIADDNAKPIAIKYPLTQEKIQMALINRQYTSNQISLIQSNYQLALSEGFTDEAKKQLYINKYNQLMTHQNQALVISQQALIKKAVP